jgi:hypothetical protein
VIFCPYRPAISPEKLPTRAMKLESLSGNLPVENGAKNKVDSLQNGTLNQLRLRTCEFIYWDLISLFVRPRFVGSLSYRPVRYPHARIANQIPPLWTFLKYPNLVFVNLGGSLAAQPINHSPRGSTAGRHLERTRDRQPKWRH